MTRGDQGIKDYRDAMKSGDKDAAAKGLDKAFNKQPLKNYQAMAKHEAKKKVYKNAAEYINSKEFGEFHKGRKEQARGIREGHIKPNMGKDK